MNSNLLRHRLLGILSRQFILVDKSRSEHFGVPFEKIYKELKCNESELRLLTSELFENNEIGNNNTYNIIGLHANEKGVAAFSSKKYWRIYRTNIINSIKDYVQILIPVLSLVVAVFAITLKVDNINKSNKKTQQQIEQRIELIEKQINIEKTYPKKTGTDSLSVE